MSNLMTTSFFFFSLPIIKDLSILHKSCLIIGDGLGKDFFMSFGEDLGYNLVKLSGEAYEVLVKRCVQFHFLGNKT